MTYRYGKQLLPVDLHVCWRKDANTLCISKQVMYYKISVCQQGQDVKDKEDAYSMLSLGLSPASLLQGQLIGLM